MVRRVVVRFVAWLLIVNGIGGVIAVWAGWTMTTTLLDGLHQSSTLVSYFAHARRGVFREAEGLVA